jgi:integrase
VARPKNAPGTYGKINTRLVSIVAPPDVDLLRGIDAPPHVLAWLREHPEAVTKIASTALRKNRKVKKVFEAETRVTPELGGDPFKVTAWAEGNESAAEIALRAKLAKNGFLTRRPGGRSGSTSLTPESTISDLMRIYTERIIDDPHNAKRWKDATKRIKREAVNVITERLADLPLFQTRNSSIDTFLRGLREEGREHDRKECYIVLKDAFLLAIRLDAVTPGNNPTIGQAPPLRRSKDEIQSGIVWMDAAQVQQIRLDLRQYDLDRIGKPGPKPTPKYRALFDVLIATAARVNEALAIRKQDILFDDEGRMLIWINGTIALEDGSSRLFRQDSTKTGREKVVILPQATAELLTSHLSTIADKPEDWLVFGTRTGKPDQEGNVSRGLAARSQLLANVGNDGVQLRTDGSSRFHLHATRSTAATHIARGATVEKAAGLLAHDGLGSIHHYVPAEMPRADESIVGLMEELLPALPEP